MSIKKIGLMGVVVATAAVGYWWFSQSNQTDGASNSASTPAQTAQGPQGQAPQGQRPQGQRPQGQAAQGQRPQGQGPRRGGPGANQWNAPVPVTVVSAQTSDLKVQFKTIGTVTASNTVLVQSRVSGPLLKLNFQEGQYVKAGEVLAEIDPAPYQVKLSQAEGQLQQNLAQLKNAEADLGLYSRLKAQTPIKKLYCLKHVSHYAFILKEN